MALTRINERTVELLITAQLQDALVAGGVVTFVPQGAPQPDSEAKPWARIVRIDHTGVRRQRRDAESDRAILTVVINVNAPAQATQDDAYAISMAMNAVAAALGECRLVNSPKTHEVVLDRPTCQMDGEIDAGTGGDRGLRTGAVIITGYAQAS